MIGLRDLQPSDAERLFAWRNQPDVARWLCGRPSRSLAHHQAWFDEFQAAEDRRGWIITDDGTPVGFISLGGFTDQTNAAQWTWYIGEAPARGRGAGRAAQALGLAEAFDGLGLDKVWSEVLAGNDAALRAQAAVGFRREGYFRDHVLKDGVRHDSVRLGLLAREWKADGARLTRDLAAARLIAA